MNLSTELRNIRQEAQAIGQRIQALEAGRNTQPHAYRFSYSTTPIGNRMERPVYACKVMAGLNELDAEVRLRQFLNREGLYLRSILATVKTR